MIRGLFLYLRGSVVRTMENEGERTRMWMLDLKM